MALAVLFNVNKEPEINGRKGPEYRVFALNFYL